jgi:hypothetical protein
VPTNGSTQASYSDIDGGFSGRNNLNTDPLFVNPSAGNFQLQGASPCVNAGNSTDVPPGITTDLSGNSRIIGMAVDLGAYEYQGFALTGITWTGNASDLEWSDPANWSDDQVPNQATAVTIPNNAYVELDSGSYSVGSLTMLGSGTVDLTSATLFIDYGANADPIASIVADLDEGYSNGSWLGSGIISSTVAIEQLTQSKLVYSVGYADGADGIVNALSSGQIEIMPTLAGDAKMQGNVVFGDFQLLSQYFGKSNTSWDEGNFTYGSTTNFGDFQLLSQNFGGSASIVEDDDVAGKPIAQLAVISRNTSVETNASTSATIIAAAVDPVDSILDATVAAANLLFSDQTSTP